MLMFARHQLPVASPISVKGLLRATTALLHPHSTTRTAITQTLHQRFHARAVTFTDSGTSALALALRIAVGRDNTAAFPAYVCVDLIAAARYAGIKVRLYDVDPHTLSPDLDSVRRVLAHGAAAIVVVHLYGLPVDVDAVRTIANEHGTVVIEDAAQHAGATLHGRHTGSLGDLSILSFGRGKGTTAGNGGALLALTPHWEDAVRTAEPSRGHTNRGTRDIIGATASWLMGRPSIYALPASIPSLHLGETIYHDPHEPAPLSNAGAALLETALHNVDQVTAHRQQHAATLRAATEEHRVRTPNPVRGGIAGYLRFPIIAPTEIPPVPQLGIMRGYPRALDEQPELRDLLCPSQESLAGARTLAQHLLTLPTHHLLTRADLTRLEAWLQTVSRAAISR